MLLDPRIATITFLLVVHNRTSENIVRRRMYYRLKIRCWRIQVSSCSWVPIQQDCPSSGVEDLAATGFQNNKRVRMAWQRKEERRHATVSNLYEQRLHLDVVSRVSLSTYVVGYALEVINIVAQCVQHRCAKSFE